MSGLSISGIYDAMNNSIGVMDSLQMNYQIIKSGLGYDTDKDPVEGDFGYLVNRNVSISVVTGKVIDNESSVGFEFCQDTDVAKVDPSNAPKTMRVSREFYQPWYDNDSLPTLLKNRVIAYS